MSQPLSARREEPRPEASEIVRARLEKVGASGSTSERIAQLSGLAIYLVVASLETLTLEGLAEVRAWTPDGDPIWRLTA